MVLEEVQLAKKLPMDSFSKHYQMNVQMGVWYCGCVQIGCWKCLYLCIFGECVCMHSKS